MYSLNVCIGNIINFDSLLYLIYRQALPVLIAFSIDEVDDHSLYCQNDEDQYNERDETTDILASNFIIIVVAHFRLLVVFLIL